MGYRKDAVKGISWITSLRGLTRGMTFVRTAVLARLLTPAEFGIFGIASLVLAFLEVLTETGINVFLMQEKEGIDKYISSAWVVSILRGTVLALCIILFSPLIVLFFKTPEAYQVLFLIATVPFIRGFINPAIISLQKNLQFNKEFWLRASVFFLDSFIVIGSAFVFQSAISFALGMIAGAFFEVLISFLFITPYPKLTFEIEKIKRVLHRGKWVTIYGVFTYLAQEGDNIVVGRILGTSPLGLYQVAYKFSTLPISEVTDVISKVMFPVYTRIADDRVRLLRAFIITSIVNTIGVLFISTLLFFFAKEIVEIFLGSAWQTIVPLIKILVIYGVLRAIFGSVSAIFLALGKQEYVATITFARVVGLLLTIIPLTMMYGLIGAAYSAITSVVLELPVIIYLVMKVFKQKPSLV